MENTMKEKTEFLTKEDYPLGSKRPDLLFTPREQAYNDLTLDAALKGEITGADLRISPKTLEMHANISESLGRTQLAKNFRRAAEMIKISDARILEIYNALRPNRSTKEELLAIADELEEEYEATENAELIREAANVYERRGRLKKNED
ncbi:MULTISPECIES: diol dehydratase small subunit [Peribacillus]|uniref:diol dehydratase small subunit n=1 Tax=Peribacillus TaxID=2675229 RepID=UPI001F5023AF|nr:diol dehydratase small subunit [Peribacillus frigoritolerans]MCK2020587.1 diol dehydratase small subunit [Peribacillus frigoritolerans]MEB2631162.1 diol dehydratase small subunit [Peribacillus frigoritolerans]MED3761844.1 diol dehydratase small subunit [Peribacillus frigoritolerans]